MADIKKPLLENKSDDPNAFEEAETGPGEDKPFDKARDFNHKEIQEVDLLRWW